MGQEMNEEISVSVIIPCYNMELYVKECIDSVLKQTLENIEVICIDDGSTDKTLSILQNYDNPNIRVMHQENQGVASARNRGINLASGKFICFMDPDDYYPAEGILKKLYDTAIERNVKICGGSFSKNHNGEIKTQFVGIYKNYTFLEDKYWNYSDYQFDYGYHRFIYDRDMLLHNEIFFPPYIRFQDPPFFVKAMITAGQFYAIKDVVYCYRVGHQNLDWNEKRTNHVLHGLCDILEMSRENKLEKLHTLTISRLVTDYKTPIKKNIRCKSIQNLLKNAQSLLDYSLLDDKKYTSEIIQLVFDALTPPSSTNVKKSNRPRAKAFFTFVPRKCRGAFRILKQKGIMGLIKRILHK